MLRKLQMKRLTDVRCGTFFTLFFLLLIGKDKFIRKTLLRVQWMQRNLKNYNVIILYIETPCTRP